MVVAKYAKLGCGKLVVAKWSKLVCGNLELELYYCLSLFEEYVNILLSI